MNIFIACIYLVIGISVFLFAGGTAMLFRYRHEKLRFWWAVIMMAAGIVMSIEAYLAYINADTFFTTLEIPFTIHLMLEWYVIALPVALVCITALKGNISKRQMTVFLSLMLANFVMAGCYEYFNGHYTHLYSWRDILGNLGKKDVQVKVLLFLSSLISSTYMFFKPFIQRMLIRKQIRLTGWFWFYMFFIFLQPISYILYALGIPAAGIVLGLGCLTFIIVFTIQFLKNENPMVEKLSTYTPKEVVVAKTLNQLTEAIKTNKYFLDKNLTVQKLASKTGMYSHLIITEYEKKGFSDFQEFINAFRLIYYKELRALYPNVPPYLLISDSGFPSQEAFDEYVKKTSKG